MEEAGFLQFLNVVKAFGGTQALRGVSLGVGRGEVVALLGENGAGKSTLIKILGGVYPADGGAVSIDGKPYRHRADARGGRQRVAFVHQDLGLIEWMTVAENMALAQGFPRRGGLGSFSVVDWREAEKRAGEALALIGGQIDPRRRVRSLSRTEKSLVAIARALVVDCDFLVLDEPTASLPADEVERLFDAIRRLKARGVGMIYVSHRLDEIFRIADRVIVMRDGSVVGEKPSGQDQSRRADRPHRRPLDFRTVSQGGEGRRPDARGRAQSCDARRGAGRFRCPGGGDSRPGRFARRGPGGDRARPVRRRVRTRVRFSSTESGRSSVLLAPRFRPASASSRAIAPKNPSLHL